MQTEILDFVSQEFELQRFKEFVSAVFSKGEGFEFQRETFEELGSPYHKLKRQYSLLPRPLELEKLQTLQFCVFEVESIHAKIGLHQELKERLRVIGSSAILACFYQKGNPSFRLSLITRSIKEGKIDYSNLKRQSFTLGKSETIQTALRNFTTLAQEWSSSPTLDALTQAFSIEPVTKEFFKEISEFFIRLTEEIQFSTPQKDTQTRQFVLRLLSRILFCKFLEKKGVIDSKVWDTKLSKGEHSYYHEVLEPLFFLTLNTKTDTRNYGLIPQEIAKLLQDIPYLNGGLFSPQATDHYDPNHPTKHINTLKIPNPIFKDLFETLERFHFTIDESTPIDQEVGLDPEMLGMVFENLLSVLFTDNKIDKLSNLRKNTGSFYTPREIVSYMVKSSILEHLKTQTSIDKERLEALVFRYEITDPSTDLSTPLFSQDETGKIIEELQGFKVLDPACGSGAFPMGMLQEICAILELLDPQAKAFLNLQPQAFKDQNAGKDPAYIRKLSILQNNIYGVDLQPMATEISRLRCFLSLICDEDKDHIAPLPNLEFKFVTANSLIPMPKNGNILIHDAYSTIKEVMDRYFTGSDEDKKSLQKRYREAQKIIAKEYEFSPFAEYDPFDSQSVAGFFDSDTMFRVQEFDCVIGNPPYIKEADHKEIFANTKHLRTYQGKMDLWYHFVGRGLDVLRENGELSFIATNNWTTNAGAKNLRNVVCKETQILKLIDFNSFMVFDSASIQTMIMRFKKVKPPKCYTFKLSRIQAQKPTHDDALALLNDIESPNNEIFSVNFAPEEHINQTFNFNKGECDELLLKIKKNGEFYLEENEAQIGIGLTDKVKKKMSLTSHEIGAGIFQITTNELKKLNLTDDELKLIKPLYTSNELSSFYGNPNNSEWVIYTDSSFKNPDSMNKYPNLKKHLDNFRDVITSDNKPYGLHRAKQEHFFNQTPSIVSLRKCPNKPIFTYVDFDCYVTSTFFIIKTDRIDLKLLTGILNSKLIAFWLKHKGKMQGNNYQIDKEPLLNIPIPQIDSKNKKTADQIIALVEQILASKESNPQAETTTLESKIDQLVYALYGLTPEEVKIIEGEK